MAKQTKSKTTEVAETTTAPVSSSSVVEQQAVAVEKVKATKTPKAPKSVVSDVASVVAEVPVVVAPTEAVANTVVADTVVELEGAETTDIATQTIDYLAKLNQASTLIATLKAEFRSLEKKFQRELKAAQKSQSKRKRKVGNRAPSGFVKPTKISDELAKFLEKPVGSEMARTEVTRDINTYIRLHNLQDKENGRKIIPDAKLQTLLKLKKTDELTYFNLQRYMSPHFSKAVKATA
jgi:upstream activation factor subunit UAF30